MLFIDYVNLLLTNATAGLAVLAFYLLFGFRHERAPEWAAGLGIAGLVSLVGGFVMCFTWPLPGPYGAMFGESSVLLGALLMGTAVSVARGWGLWPMAVYAVLPGLYALVTGLRIIDLGLTKAPVPSGLAFLLAGLVGIVAPVGVWLRRRAWLRVLAALALLGAVAIWGYTIILATWMHIEHFAKWAPK